MRYKLGCTSTSSLPFCVSKIAVVGILWAASVLQARSDHDSSLHNSYFGRCRNHAGAIFNFAPRRLYPSPSTGKKNGESELDRPA
jgi:hypothetical protein